MCAKGSRKRRKNGYLRWDSSCSIQNLHSLDVTNITFPKGWILRD